MCNLSSGRGCIKFISIEGKENIKMYKWECPFPPGVSPLPTKKSNPPFILRFCWNLKHNIFICLPIIIEMEMYERSPLTLRGPFSPSKKSNLKQNICICLPIIIEIKILKWRLIAMETLLLPSPSKSQIFIYGAILLKFDAQHFHMFTNNKL